MPLQHLRYTVSGRVQRVYFRATTKAQAEKLGIGGYVQNNPDGTVTGEAIGEPSSIDAFTEWLWKGPEQATVQHVETFVEDVEEDPYKGTFEKKKNRR
ncbi:hypothetical protein FRB96_005307 [Tulasnella sp. 330]|nr:hypothetical protein FRB96_005307 [Tulasnella sp. 330]KAG8874542.1 hypothetical protein FRB97_005842 [Tulasnella sp. 331]KAG8878193.1 hypothetical protein FRB98_006325 [Tulasnella sp. 332]